MSFRFASLSLVMILVPALAVAQQRPAGPLKPITAEDAERAAKGETAPAPEASGKFAPNATALIDEAKTRANANDDRAAADALHRATKVTKLGTDVRKTLDGAIAHLAEGRHAESEKGFVVAKEQSPNEPIALAGLEIAHQRRVAGEKGALAALETAPDPRVPAAVLKASLLVEPNHPAIPSALDKLAKRARASSVKSDDAAVSRALDAMALLEARADEMRDALLKAGGLFAESKHSEAELAYRPLVESIDGTSSKTAALGRELARERRVAALRKEIDDAKKNANVIQQSKANKHLLELLPQDRAALDLARRIKTPAVDARLARAKNATKEGQLGTAWLELARAQELDAGNTKVVAERAQLEKQLRETSDLIIRVSRVTRDAKVSSGVCKGLDERIAEHVMEEGSARTDLGGYLLSKAWTEAVDRKDARAPVVSGELTMKIDRCESGAATGKTAVSWAIQTSGGGDKPVAKGAIEVALPQGLIPRDEQDGEGNNAKNALAARVSKAVLDSIQAERAATETWLLSLAESAVQQKDEKRAADAYARLSVRQRAYDSKRVEALKAWLDAEVE